MLEELQAIVRDRQVELEVMARRLDRKVSGQGCVLLSDHFCKSLITAVGNPFLDDMTRTLGLDTNVRFGWHSYQIARCYICEQYLLAFYDGELKTVISQEEAMRWS